MAESGVTVACEPSVLLAELTAFPDDLASLLRGRAAEALVQPASDGGWSVVENLCHLRDWEEIFLDRIQTVIEQDRPALPAYDDELWPIERDYRNQQAARVVDQLRENRRRLVALLAAQPPTGWARVGCHELRGEVTVCTLVQLLRSHAEEHRQQIRETLG